MSRSNTTKCFLIILGIGFLVYLNSLFNNFTWEDWGQLANNQAVQKVVNIPIFFRSGPYLAVDQYFSSQYYRPIMLTYFALVSSLFGAGPFQFHFFQLLIHIINTFLVFIFLKKIIKNKSAFFVSLIFLVHPINVETVSYISSSSNILYFFFGMLGLVVIDKSLLLSGVLFTLSIFSNETGILFLLIAPMYSYMFNKKTVIKTGVSSIFVFQVYLLGRLQIAKINFGNTSFFPMERLSLFDRLLTMPSVIFFYISTFFFPVSLSTGRLWSVRSFTDVNFYIPLAVIMLVSVGLLFLWKKILLPKQRKAYLFFIVWIILGLGICSQIYALDVTVADRWFYFPEVGVIGIIGILLDRFHNHKNIKFVYYVLIIILLLFSLKSIERNFNWKNDDSLFSHDINISPNSYLILEGKGIVELQKGNTGEAERYLKKAYMKFPYEETIMLNLKTLNNIKHNSNSSGLQFIQ